MNSSKNHSFLKEGENRETSTPECSPTPNQPNTQHNLNTKKTNNKLTYKESDCYHSTLNTKVVLRLYKSNGLQKTICDTLGDSKKLTRPQTIRRVHAINLTKNKNQKNKNQNSTFHRVCTVHNTPPVSDPNRSKTYENNSTTLLLLIKQYYHTTYSILTHINMLFVLLGFIIYLFIIIYNLLFIYSLLFISLLLFILYYLFLFLEEKNKPIKNRETPHFTSENTLFIKNNRRPLYG